MKTKNDAFLNVLSICCRHIVDVHLLFWEVNNNSDKITAFLHKDIFREMAITGRRDCIINSFHTF